MFSTKITKLYYIFVYSYNFVYNFIFCSFDLLTACHQIASVVGFSVYAEDSYQFPDMGKHVSFPLVRTNIGGHYDPSESVFTCPTNGTYYFIFNLCTGHLSNSENTAAYIQKDEEDLSQAYCTSWEPNSIHAQCGNSAVTHCHLGQHVFVAARYHDTQVYSYYKSSTFSGFLIHADVAP